MTQILHARAASLVSPATRQFVRHYVEMLVAMVAGMIVLGGPATVVLGAAGMSSSELRTDYPSLMLLGMAVVMTVPMVAWMRYRGHGWAANTEMAASMIVPTLFVIGLLAAGAVTDYHALMGTQHTIMFPAMFGVMLLRRDEYSHGHQHH